MSILLKANKAKKDQRVEGSFEEVIEHFSQKPEVKITDCRIDETGKNKTLWVNEHNMCTIVHPDNELMTVEKYIELSDYYNKIVDKSNDKLKLVISGKQNSSGLVSDECRSTDEYKEANKQFTLAFNNLRLFNSTVPNSIKREVSKIRRNNKIKN